MKFENRYLTLKDGRKCILRPTTAEYAQEMIDYLIELARQIGYEQMELEYVEGNDTAKRLYEKCGFVETGKRVKAMKYDDGTYKDEFIMSKSLQ